jgi:sulfhydrogenase subunit delta
MTKAKKPKLAVWKFASCSGCQLAFWIARMNFWRLPKDWKSHIFRRLPGRYVKGPYDLSLVEGSITTPHDAERIHKVRRNSKFLVTIGACATAGGIQALAQFQGCKGIHFDCVCLSPIY